VTVLVVQMATATFSARIMRLWCRDRMLTALAVLVGTLTLAFSVLRRIEDDFVTPAWRGSVDLDRVSGADGQGIDGPAYAR